MRSIRDSVTFGHPFRLAGLDGVQPPGTYLVITEEEELPNLSFVAWRRISTVMHVPSIGTDSVREQAITIDPHELAAARKQDDAGDVS